MHAAADGLIHVSNLYATAPGERLAATLVEKSFASKVFFCNSGAEANEGAFKFARRWARTQGRGEARDRRAARQLPRAAVRHARGDRSPVVSPSVPSARARHLHRRARHRRPRASRSIAETTAALILEPVQGEGGVRVLDAGFVREVRALTKERDVALIFDEIQCGLGRTGTLFAYEHFGVEPDMLTLAKPIAGGSADGRGADDRRHRVDDQAGRSRHDVRRRTVRRVVANHVVERLSDPALLEHVTTNRRVVRQAAHRSRASHGRIRAVRGHRFHVGHRRDGNGVARGERGVRGRACSPARRANTPFAFCRRSSRRATIWRSASRILEEIL